MSGEYLLAGRASEVQRLTVQSEAWEPAGRALLATLGSGEGLRVLDVGCGVHGWLRPLSTWVGATGTVVGTDVNPDLLAVGRRFAADEGLGNVELVVDDLFASALEPASFDLVHARFLLAPLGRGAEQVAAYRRLLRPGGMLVLEDPDTSTWGFDPPAPAAQELVDHVRTAFRASGGDLDQGPANADLLRDAGLDPSVVCQVLELPPGDPYLRLPLAFAESLRPRLEPLVGTDELARLMAEAERELGDPLRGGRPYALVQTWARVP